MNAEQWNALYPIGTPVAAYPSVRPEHSAAKSACKRLVTVTRTPAWTLGHGEPVVSVVGYAGGISLTHVDPVPAGLIAQAHDFEDPAIERAFARLAPRTTRRPPPGGGFMNRSVTLSTGERIVLDHWADGMPHVRTVGHTSPAIPHEYPCSAAECAGCATCQPLAIEAGTTGGAK